MKHLIKISILFILLSNAQKSFGQDTLRLSHNEFLSVVKNYHPLAFRYRLQNKIASAEIQKARGNFDPMLDAQNGAKTIDGIDYYQESNIGIGIPTWYGIELNGSYNNIEGQKINNSETVGGLYQFGVTVPLGKNLLYDKRRALLDQAKFAKQMTEAEQQLFTNQLLLDAENTYWKWVMHYEIYLLQKRAVEYNQARFNLIRRSYEYGEQAAIDTTEALSQLQGFELQLQDAFLQWINTTQELSLFLWTENQQPYNLTQMVMPSENINNNLAYENYASLFIAFNARPIQQHAALQFLFQEQNLLKSERRLIRQSLLPKLDFTYNFYNQENNRSKYFPMFQNNYQYGWRLEIPLFLRQERANVKIIQSRIQQNKLDADFKQQELNAKIATYQNELINYNNQIDIAERNIVNYQRLLNAEETRYSNGESTLFLINTRENKLLEAEQKLLQLKLKFLTSYNQLKWLNENF